MFQPRGRHEIQLKRDRQVYIPPLPALTRTSVFHFCTLSLLSSNAPPLWFALAISMKRVRTFSNRSSNRHIVMLVPSSLNCPVCVRIKSFSVGILHVVKLSSDANGCLFYKRSKEIFRDPRGNVEIYYIFLWKTLQRNKQAKPCLPFRCVNIYK